MPKTYIYFVDVISQWRIHFLQVWIWGCLNAVHKESLVKQEKEAIGGEEIRGEYVRVGSLGEVSEDGNWPPFYDKGDKKDNE